MKEYAGTDLTEIRQFFMQENEIRYTEVYEDRGAEGFTLNTFHEDGATYASFVVVWPRKEGGYWCEEY